MRVGQKNKLTYRWARKGSRPRAAHDQRTQSTYLFGAVCPDRGAGAALVLPGLQQRSHAASSRRDRHQGRTGRPRHSHSRSSRLAWRQGTQDSDQHLASVVTATLTRAQQPREHMAVHAPELAVEPDIQIVRRYRRSLLLRLEYTHRPAL